MEIIFHSHANKTHFHKKGCAPGLILKVRVFGTRKWPFYFPFSKKFSCTRIVLLFSPVHMYSFSNRNGYWPQIIPAQRSFSVPLNSIV